MTDTLLPYGIVTSPVALGQLVRQRRKGDRLTQAEVAALCGVGTRFLSELERGKATAELGKTLRVLRGLGLELSVTPRGGSAT
jgi:HTH-type transcriptional regulator/antitoxin HipB